MAVNTLDIEVREGALNHFWDLVDNLKLDYPPLDVSGYNQLFGE